MLSIPYACGTAILTTLWLVNFSTATDLRASNVDPAYSNWPDNQILYYLDLSYTAAEKDLIRRYASRVQEQLMGCVNLLETTASDKRFKMKITPLTKTGTAEQYCSVFPGVVKALVPTGEQRTVMARGDSGCLDAEGLGDRDQYIKMNNANMVLPDAFRLYTENEASWAGRQYDYCSITHDAPADLAKPGSNTYDYLQGPPTALQPATAPSLSLSDCQIIRSRYGCDASFCLSSSTSTRDVRAGCLAQNNPFRPPAPANGKQLVRDLLNSENNGATAPLAAINDHKYIQHNPDVADGKAGYVDLWKASNANPSANAKVVRIFQDGEFVFTHFEDLDIKSGLGVYSIDVFRFEDGQIVEHWGNTQASKPVPNGAGHTMTDGPTQARDLDKTAVNKALVRGYVEDVLGPGRWDLSLMYFTNGQLIQHNPRAKADGLAQTRFVVKSLPAGSSVCSRMRYLLGEGDFVLTMCEGTYGINATAYYDLYRLENGKIAEHWDVWQKIQPCDEWKNLNSKF